MLRAFLHALAQTWAIEPRHGAQLAAAAYLVQARQMDLAGDLFAMPEKQPAGYLYADVMDESGTDIVGRIAVHDIEGTLMREDGLCSDGMVSMSERFAEADEDEQVLAHVLRIHSPGGTVAGTETFAQRIATSEKPVVVHTEMAFSAAYWLASAADMIMLSGENAAVGSIGVLVSYMDYHKFYEQKGIEHVLIKATTSPDKAKYSKDPLSEEQIKGFQEEDLDPLDANFMAWVREHRPGVSETALTGNTYYAQDALKHKLADSIGTFQDALNLAATMASEQKLVTNQSDTDMSQLNRSQPAANEPQPAVQQEPVAQTNTPDVQDSPDSTEIGALQASVAQMQEIIARQERTIAALNTVNANLQAEITRLSQLPASDPEQAVTSPKADASTKAQQQPMSEAERVAMAAVGDQPASEDFLAAVAIGNRRKAYEAAPPQPETETIL